MKMPLPNQKKHRLMVLFCHCRNCGKSDDMQQIEDKQYNGDDQERMEQSSEDMGGQKPREPENKKNYGDSYNHNFILIINYIFYWTIICPVIEGWIAQL
jgi:hypothetical protein